MRILRKYRIIDWSVTLAVLAVLVAAVVWLESSNPKILSGDITVIDGDSLIINEQSVRLLGIDAPELAQMCEIDGKPWRCGRRAKRELRELIKFREVQCTSTSQDIYQRSLATCEFNGTDINARLVLDGWAVNYGGYVKQEAIAKKHRRGLWRGDFQRPAQWRRAHRDDDSQSTSLITNFFRWIKGH